MYPKIKLSLRKTSLKVNKSTEGETMEMRVTRLFANNQTTTDGAPLIYTEKKIEYYRDTT